MAATNYDFTIEQGTIFGLDFVYKNSSNQIIDMSNYCCTLRIQPNGGSNTNLITYSTTGINVKSSYAFILYPSEGKISLRLPAETTNSFDWESAIYELEVITPELFYRGGSRVVKRLLKGTITLDKRSIPSSTIPTCITTQEGGDNAEAAADAAGLTSSFGILDSCIGSPCEFIGGDATIYEFINSSTDESVMYLRDKIVDENPYGKSSPFPFSLSAPESKLIERLDVFIDGFTHSSPQDIRLLLTHNGSGVLLLDQNKFTSYSNKPKNLSFVISDYAVTRPNGERPTVANVIDYNFSLLENKNLGVALPGLQGQFSLNNKLIYEAFDSSDSNRDISVYGSGLKTFEGMNVNGSWKLYGIDYNNGDAGAIRAIKLIVYFQNEQSNNLNNSSSCGLLPRTITLIGTAVTISGDLTSQLSNSDIIIIEYNNGTGTVASTRTISSAPSYSTGTGNTTFTIDSAIGGTVNNPKLIKYNTIG